MWIVVGFASLGLVIGNLVGFSADSITTSVAGLLFAFAGGSAVTFMRKLTPDARKESAQAIAALALSCLLGVYASIYVSEHRILSPASTPPSAAPKDNKYLFGNVVSTANGIDSLYRSGRLPLEDAYDQLYELVESMESGGPGN